MLLIISCQEKEEKVEVEEGLHGPRDGEDDKEGDTNDDKGSHSRRNNNSNRKKNENKTNE